ncbi:MAG: TIM barrel protein [Candidatus Diapherotrites archaeon]|nr:TIM barrel protein [Candidatus Diapherotrites archaeon]
MFSKLNFATAGIPLSTQQRSTENGLKQVKKLGLDGMELEFVHSVNISKEKAPEIKKIAEDQEITLSCHAPYFINLNAREKEKIHASRQRIMHSAEIAFLCGAKTVTFHAGFYLGEPPEKVFEKIKKEIKEIRKELDSRGIKILLSPETTGKGTQFGSLKELIDLSKEIDGVQPCIDFSHLHARSNGKMNSFNEFSETLEAVEKELGKKALTQMHMHSSGIAYSEKGERNHLIFTESDFKFKELMKALKEFNVKGQLVCESPNIEEDALLLKKTYQKI